MNAPRPRPASPTRWAWMLVAIVALMGGALLVTVYTTYAGVRAASTTLARGQAEAVRQAVVAELAELDEAPTADDVVRIFEGQSQAGARFVAVLGAGNEIIASAGEARLGPIVRPRRGDDFLFGEDRVRVFFGPRGGPPPGDPAFSRPRRPRRARYGVVVELEPVQAAALRAAAARTLGVGGVAATSLLVFAALLVRWALRREAGARQQEHERRLASLGELSAVLAHEIRNPLASLKGNAQLLVQMLPADGEAGPSKAARKAERIVDEARRLETLTNDLLDFVRTGQIQRREVAPGELLAEAAASVDGEAITVDTAGAPPAFPLDALRMRQVLVNLLENAVQAGLPVRAKVVALGGGRLVFEVRDSGPGVPAEDRERIFEPFFTRRVTGTGLGLAVARRVVELHGGTITVGDAEGGGAVFRVLLPQGG